MSAEPAAARTLAGRLARAWGTDDDEGWMVTLKAYERVVGEDRLRREHGDVSAARAEFDKRFRAFVRGGEAMAREVDELERLLALVCAPPDAAEPTGALLQPRTDYIALRSKLRRWDVSARKALLRAVEVYRLLPDAEKYKVVAEWGEIQDGRGEYVGFRRRLPVDRLDLLDLRAAWFDAASPYWGVSRAYLEVAEMFARAATPVAWRAARETAVARGLDDRKWGRWANKAHDRLKDAGVWPSGYWPTAGAAEQAAFAAEGEG